MGVLSALDGYVEFQNHHTTIQKTAAWISNGHAYGFGMLVAAEIKDDYHSSSST